VDQLTGQRVTARFPPDPAGRSVDRPLERDAPRFEEGRPAASASMISFAIGSSAAW
jgi:hypothetical protein